MYKINSYGCVFLIAFMFENADHLKVKWKYVDTEFLIKL